MPPHDIIYLTMFASFQTVLALCLLTYAHTESLVQGALNTAINPVHASMLGWHDH